MLTGRIAWLAGLLLLAPPGAWSTVEIAGLEGVLLDNARAHVQLVAEPCDAPEWRVRRLYRQAEPELRESLEAYGYYAATVSRSLRFDADCWTATLTVDAGEPVRIRAVDVQVDGPGRAQPEFAALRMNSPVVVGNTLEHAAYERDKRRFGDTAARLGYFDARFTTARIDVHVPEQAADIVLVFETGPRYRYGDVLFDQAVISEALAARYVDFVPGQAYDAAQIRELYEALLETSYFSSVDIRTKPRAAPDAVVDVAVRLNAAKHRSYSAGIGYGTDVGPKVRAGYINRRRNLQGHQLEIKGSYSEVIVETGASYRLPLNNPRQQWLNFDIGYKSESPDTSKSRLYKAGVKRFQRQGERWLRTVFLDYALEDYTVGLDSGRSRLLTPGVSWKRSAGGKLARPLKGLTLNLQLSGAADVLLSDTSFFQVLGSGKFVRPLWDGARVIGRLEVGATFKDDFAALPASVRFFAGGDTSVRGYDYKALGPRDAQGDVIGGSQLIASSLELDQLVRPNWSVAAFVDAGNAFDKFWEESLAVGVGAGVRWYSPLGPIRFDIAVPLKSSAPDAFRVHITLGPDL